VTAGLFENDDRWRLRRIADSSSDGSLAPSRWELVMLEKFPTPPSIAVSPYATTAYLKALCGLGYQL